MLTILLIRGLSRQQGHWGDFTCMLAQAFEERDLQVNIVFEDLPGFGNRFQQNSPATIEKIAELLIPTLEKLFNHKRQKIHLLGISMGGMIALELARQYPEYCQSLVMINSSVKPVSNFYERLRPTAYPAFIKAFLHPHKRESERQILNISSELHSENTALLNAWLSLRNSQPPSRLAVYMQILAASRFQAPVQPPIKNVLLIASKKDRVVNYKCTIKLAQYWDLNAHLHQTAGHDLALDDPVYLVHQLMVFYKDCR